MIKREKKGGGGVIPGITLARQVNIEALQVKRLHELRVKAHEFFGEFFFILDVHFALGIADSDGLFHPHDIGQISPVVRIGGWTWVKMISETCIFSLSITILHTFGPFLPQKRSIFR